MAWYVDYTNRNTCSYPACGAPARITLRTGDHRELAPLDIPVCLRHERHITGALKLLGMDAEAIMMPSPAAQAST